MNLRVERIGELVEHDSAGVLDDKPPGALHRFRHQDAGRQHDLRTQVAEEGHTFRRHGLRHRQDQAITADGRYEGEADAGVAAGRFDDGRTGREDATPLGILDQRDAQPVLHAAARIAHFELGEDAARQPTPDPLERHQRRAA